MGRKNKELEKDNIKNSIICMDSLVLEKKDIKSVKKSYFLNSLIAFFFIAGISGLMINSFEFECRTGFLIFIAFILSFIISFSYYNRAIVLTVHSSLTVLIIAYIAVNIQELYYGINSVINILIRSVNAVMSLPFVRTYDEDFSSRTSNITAFFLVIIFVMSILYCFALAKGRVLLLTTVITLLILEFSTYLHNDISLIYPSMIILACILILLKKYANTIPFSLKKRLKSFRIDRKQIHLFNTDLKLKSILCTALFVFLLSFTVFKAVNFIVSDKFYSTNSPLKNITDQYVYMVAWKGFDNLKNGDDMENTGGLNNGTFGNVREIIYDNKTDLTVTFVPTSRNPVYIPTFMGDTYDPDNRKWTSSNAYLSSNAYNSVYLSTCESVKSLIKYKKTTIDGSIEDLEPENVKVGEGTMLIKNISVSDGILPLPYYTVDNDDFHKIGIDEERMLDYVTTQYTYSEIAELIKEHRNLLNNYDYNYNYGYSDYYNNDTSKYLKLSNEQYRILERFCQRNNISGSTTDVINQIRELFAEEYSYTLSPGTTPDGADFVSYFLNEQKSGFCVHFASAACLLLRYNNIPARYVEGYLINNEAYKSSKSVELEEDESFDDYYDGYSDLSTKMITVELPDSNAHAWVEIYINGFGWIPVEFTVGYYNDTPGDVNTTINNATGSMYDKLKNTDLVAYLIDRYTYISGKLKFIIPCCIIIIAIIYKFVMNYRLYYAPDEVCAKNQYNLILKTVRKELQKKKGFCYDRVITHEKLIVLLKKEFAMNDGNTIRLIRGYEEFLFYDRHRIRLGRINERFYTFIESFSANCNILKRFLLRFGCFKFFKYTDPRIRKLINAFVKIISKPIKIIQRLKKNTST